MLQTGLVSVTFRKLPPQEIIVLARKAGIDGIEWGGDVHVPHGEEDQAREVGKQTRNAGLQVAAYGSYYRAGHEAELPFEHVLQSAVALEAPLIRVWAGKQGAGDSDEAYRAMVADDTRRICDLAARAGIKIAFEFHGGTLTDSVDSCLELIKRVAHPNLQTLWQPFDGLNVDERESSLRQVLPHLANVHVFHWVQTATGRERRALNEGKEDWARYFQVLRADEQSRFALLEFVRDDAPVAFLEDARVLNRLLAEVAEVANGD